MIRLRDANGNTTLPFEPLEAGRAILLSPDESLNLMGFRIELAAEVLGRALERYGLKVERAARPGSRPADVALIRSNGALHQAASAGQRPGRTCLAVAGILLEGREPTSHDQRSLARVLAPGPARPALRYFGLTAHY